MTTIDPDTLTERVGVNSIIDHFVDRTRFEHCFGNHGTQGKGIGLDLFAAAAAEAVKIRGRTGIWCVQQEMAELVKKNVQFFRL